MIIPEWARDEAKRLWDAAQANSDPVGAIAKILMQDDGPLLRGRGPTSPMVGDIPYPKTTRGMMIAPQKDNGRKAPHHWEYLPAISGDPEQGNWRAQIGETDLSAVIFDGGKNAPLWSHRWRVTVLRNLGPGYQVMADGYAETEAAAKLLASVFVRSLTP